MILPIAGNGLFAQENISSVQTQDSESVLFKIPFDTSYRNGGISAKYGKRRNPFTGKLFFHYGVDIPLEIGTPVIAS